MTPRLTVVVCSLNGAARIGRCLSSLQQQTIRASIEVIVVDDGSTDNTSLVADTNAVTVIRHDTNRGVSAGRNSGLRAASAPVVAFLDDDCEPGPKWAERILSGYSKDVIGVGGSIQQYADNGYLYDYLCRHNRHTPLSLDLAVSEKIPYRFYLYLKRQWTTPRPAIQQDVYAFPGANMSFLRSAIMAVGGFDEAFRFGSEEEDLCRRLLEAFPAGRLVFIPDALVLHHFEASLRTTLGRNRAYGRGSAQFYRKWPSVRPTVFPGPVLVLATLIAAPVQPALLPVALLAPQALYPGALRSAIGHRRAACLLDAYVQLAQEFCENVGFIQGLWRYRQPQQWTRWRPVLPGDDPPGEPEQGR